MAGSIAIMSQVVTNPSYNTSSPIIATIYDCFFRTHQGHDRGVQFRSCCEETSDSEHQNSNGW